MKKNFTLNIKYTFFVTGLVLLLAACSKESTLGPDEPKPAPAKKWVVSTVAGSGTAGFADGDTTQAQFSNAQGIVTDGHGNLFVADQGNFSIRQVTYAGHVTTYMDKNNVNPVFGNIYSLTRDSQGNLYTIDYNLIRKIVSPINNAVFAGSLLVNHKDGSGTDAGFNIIANIAIDNQDNIFVPDYDMNDKFILRKVTSGGVVSTLTLQDNTGYPADGLPNFHYLYAIAVDASGNIYLSSNGNGIIKKVDVTGNVTVFAGSATNGFVDGKGEGAQFKTIYGMTCDALGNLWVSDGGNHAIRVVTPDGTVTTIAGKGVAGFADGAGKDALFKYPYGIAVDNTAGVVFVMDNGNNRIRKLEYK